MTEDEIRTLRTQIRLLQRRLRREVNHPLGLSVSASQVLSEIDRHSGITPGAVGEALAMKSSNVAAALRELDMAGLVTRTSDSRDGRRVILRTTTAGHASVAGLRSERDTWLGRAVEACLDGTEQEALVKAGNLLARIADYDPSPRPDPDASPASAQ